MKNHFSNLWNRLERASTLETDSPREKRQKVTLVMIALFCCLTGVISITQGLITSRPVIEILMPFSFNIVVGTALFIYFITKRFGILLYPFLIMILCIPAFFQSSIGGFSGQGSVPIIAWSILAPFGSLMFQDIRKATYWFVAYLFLVIIFLNIDEYFTQFAELPISFEKLNGSHGDLMVSNGIAILVLSIIIFVSMRYFVNAFQKEHTRAEKLVVDLTATNSELETTLAELKKTQIELVQSEKMASLGQLTAGIAHEINNPIGVINSNINLNESCYKKIEQVLGNINELIDLSDTKKIIAFLKKNNKTSKTACKRIIDIVKSFKNFARLDEAEFQKVDIHEGIESTLTLIQHEIREGIQVIKEYGDLPQVHCFTGELNQAFMTLLTNAIRAIENEGVIKITTSVDDKNILIKLSDTRRPIPAEKLNSLFDFSFTTKKSRIGVDMGLYMEHNLYVAGSDPSGFDC